MKILNIFPRFKTASGAETLMLELARNVQQLGHEMPILTRRFSPDCDCLLDDDIHIKELRRYRWLTGVHLLDSAMDVAVAASMGAQIDSKGVDAICAWAPPALPALWYYKRIRKGKLPCIYYCLQPPEFAYTATRQVTLGYPPFGYLVPAVAPVYRRLDRRWAKAADGMMCLSTDYQRRCQAIYDEKCVPVVAPGTTARAADQKSVVALRKRHHINSDQRVLVTVNKLIPKKNIETFILTIGQLRHRMPEVRGIIVGDGLQKPALERLVQTRGLDKWVFFTGFVETRAEIAAYYRIADLHVFLGKEVPFGMTPVEAGVQQRPTLAYRGGGTLDTVVDGKSGIFVPNSTDASGIATAAHELLKSEGQLKSMGQAALEHSRNFGWDECAKRFVETMRELIDHKAIVGTLPCGPMTQAL